MRRLSRLILTTILGAGFFTTMASAENVHRIQAFRSGAITLDGKNVTQRELEAGLSAIKKGGGVLWYYRENAAIEPTDAQMKVLEAMIAITLPVSLSSKPDFSDVIGADGMSHPRK